jgi:hypothetical protein
MQEDDFVLVVGGFCVTGDAAQPIPSTSGYTTDTTVDNNIEAGVSYKFMGATPDTQVVCNNTGAATEACGYAAIVLRGVDLDTPIDVTTVVVAGSAVVDPDPGSITTITDGARIIAAALRESNQKTTQGPVGYGNLISQAANDTNPAGIHLAELDQATAGAENPGIFNFSGGSVWTTTFTIAVREIQAAVVQPPYKFSYQPYLAQ